MVCVAYGASATPLQCLYIREDTTNTAEDMNTKRKGRIRLYGAGIAYRLAIGWKIRGSNGGEKFSAPVHTGTGTHPASSTMGIGSFPGVRWPGSGVNHPPTSSAEVQERLKLNLYSPSGPSRPSLGQLYLFRVRFYKRRWNSGRGRTPSFRRSKDRSKTIPHTVFQVRKLVNSGPVVSEATLSTNRRHTISRTRILWHTALQTQLTSLGKRTLHAYFFSASGRDEVLSPHEVVHGKAKLLVCMWMTTEHLTGDTVRVRRLTVTTDKNGLALIN
jgi:hypothetical protein